ncbi:MAG: hypothetical protein U9Q62_05465 [Campylobacterota bacterium]|nr:hypothetical protein [Campylobacterota bacterium]
MPDYATLDIIADAYNPILLLLTLYATAASICMKQWRLAGTKVLLILIGAIIAYGWMLVDSHYGIWPSMGMDYSTHTATASVMAIFLFFFLKKIRAAVVVSLILYIYLMLYQEYHTLGDIASTGLFVCFQYVPALLISTFHFNKKKLD